VKSSCREVIRELSNYIDQDVQPQLRAEIEAHLPTCAHCTAIFDGLRNTITLIGDGRRGEAFSCRRDSVNVCAIS
jgi:anti-sigma factor RsiW